jgi:hypothetical protein
MGHPINYLDQTGLEGSNYQDTANGIIYCEDSRNDYWYQCGTVDDPELIEMQEREAKEKMEQQIESDRLDRIIAKGGFKDRFKGFIANDYYKRTEDDLWGEAQKIMLPWEKELFYEALKEKRDAHSDKKREEREQFRTDYQIRQYNNFIAEAESVRSPARVIQGPLMVAVGGFAAAGYLGYQAGQFINDARGCVKGDGGDCLSAGVTVASSIISVYALKSTRISPSGVAEKPNITLALSREEIAKIRAGQLGQGELTGATPIGKALKPDIMHRSAVFLHEEAELKGYVFLITGKDGVTLRYIQLPFPGGVADFILDAKGNLTHSMIRKAGKVTGNWIGK